MKNKALTRIRRLDIDAMLNDAVDWVAGIVKREQAPGLIVGLSGTDSALATVVCLKAFEKLGKPLSNMRIVNFQHHTQDKFVEMNEPFVCTKSEDTAWVERELFPWFRDRWPDARLEVDTSIEHSRDGARWGAIHDKAKEEVNGRGDLLAGTYYFPVGTRNASEDAIGAYTLITKAVSLFPIIRIFKTEVIDICRHIGIPEIAIEKSQDIDCDCGRFEIQAFHMRELDELLMAGALLIPMNVLDQGDQDVRHDVLCFLREERAINEFKDEGRTPFVPPHNTFTLPAAPHEARPETTATIVRAQRTSFRDIAALNDRLMTTSLGALYAEAALLPGWSGPIRVDSDGHPEIANANSWDSVFYGSSTEVDCAWRRDVTDAIAQALVDGEIVIEFEEDGQPSEYLVITPGQYEVRDDIHP